jgi:putative transposase
VQSIKSECLNKLVPLGERHLRRAVTEFVEHYHGERNHQGLENRLITKAALPVNDNAPIARRNGSAACSVSYYRRAP